MSQRWICEDKILRCQTKKRRSCSWYIEHENLSSKKISYSREIYLNNWKAQQSPPTQLYFWPFLLEFPKRKMYASTHRKIKFMNVPKLIAYFFELPSAEKYIGPAFRRTSATLLAESGADIAAIQRHGRWKSAQVAQGYVDESEKFVREKLMRWCEYLTEKLAIGMRTRVPMGTLMRTS